jgi:glycine cleavage system H lipoate-binding protein
VEEPAQCCRLAPFQKLVPGGDIARQDQSCSSDAWKSCAWVPQRGAPPNDRDPVTPPLGGSGERCPFLDEILACSCAAAPSSKLIPRTLLAVRRCLGDSHRYCEFFLERAGSRPPADTADRPAPRDWQPLVASAIPIAPGVALARNHMWLDVGSDGSCHVGVDAFLVRVLGAVDEVIFLSERGRGSPNVVLTVAGTTLPLVFPRPIDITGVNRALRRHLDSLIADPYGRGWLYEGWTLKPHGRTGVEARTAGLFRGPDAETWMASEVNRLSRHVHAIASRRSSHLGPVAADGGEVSVALAQHLERAELLEVFSLFFSGAAG